MKLIFYLEKFFISITLYSFLVIQFPQTKQKGKASVISHQNYDMSKLLSVRQRGKLAKIALFFVPCVMSVSNPVKPIVRKTSHSDEPIENYHLNLQLLQI